MLLNIKNQKYNLMNRFAPHFYLLIIVSMSLLSGISTGYAAEYVYISDNLRVGVRQEPVGGVPPIGVVITGMRLEVHERSEGYVRITSDKGVTGWIKDIYVTEKAPAIIQLNQFRVKYETLKKQLSEGSDTVSLLEKANAALAKQVETFKEQQQEWSKERATFVASQYKETSWLWIIEVLVAIVLSFFAGIFWYKSHVMKRLGGLRV